MPPLVTPEIVLVRHGRSAHVEPGWLDVEGLRRWMAAYDAAPIAPDHLPPAPLVALAGAAGAVVASDLPRASASAALLAGASVELTPLLRETALETPDRPLPRLGGLRLPRGGWALLFGARWAGAAVRRLPPPGVDAATLARAEEAAAWLVGMAESRGRVVAVTHTIFRTLLARALTERGWPGPDGRRPYREWSAWSHARRVAR